MSIENIASGRIYREKKPEYMTQDYTSVKPKYNLNDVVKAKQKYKQNMQVTLTP